MKRRIKLYRLAAGLSVESVAASLKVGRSTVYHWENLEHASKPTLENLIGFSELVERSVSEILGQDVQPAREGHAAARGSVPVVTPEEASDPGFLDGLQIPDASRQYLPCPETHSPATFAMVMVGPFNETNGKRSYPHGTTAYFDPAASIEPGDMVLARLASGRVVVREYVKDGYERMLRPLNGQFAPTGEPFTFVARLIGAYRSDRSE